MEQIPAEVARKILNRDFSNLVSRVQSGGKLTRGERAMLQSIAAGSSGGAGRHPGSSRRWHAAAAAPRPGQAAAPAHPPAAAPRHPHRPGRRRADRAAAMRRASAAPRGRAGRRPGAGGGAGRGIKPTVNGVAATYFHGGGGGGNRSYVNAVTSSYDGRGAGGFLIVVAIS